MTNRKLALAQAALGVAGLAWLVFLLPRTGFFWWFAANAAYAVLALIAAAVLRCGHRFGGRMLAVIGAFVFIGANGSAAIIACDAGGACGTIISVAGMITVLQIAVIKLSVG
ncbi:MAG: hypothetical protein ACR2L2_10990 [Acidobacteriota bacterium]